MSLAERLKKVLEHSGMKHAEFAMSIGMALDRFKNLHSGKVQKLTEEEARTIGKTHQFHELWLLTGRGPMRPTKDEATIKNAATQMIEAGDDVSAMGIRPELRTTAQQLLFYVARRDGDGLQAVLDSLPSSSAYASLDSGDLVLVPSYGVEASAGNGAPVNDEHVIGRFAFKRSWLARKGLNPQHLAVVTARGDSMEPTVRDGDILLVDRNVTRISADGIYLIERDNELYCKRLQRLFDGGVTIMSDNPRYEAQQLAGEAADALNVTGRVIWIGGER